MSEIIKESSDENSFNFLIGKHMVAEAYELGYDRDELIDLFGSLVIDAQYHVADEDKEYEYTIPKSSDLK